MPSPMSGRGKELMGYKVTDTHLLVGALVIFVAGTAWARRPGSATTKVLKENATSIRMRARDAAKVARQDKDKPKQQK